MVNSNTSDQTERYTEEANKITSFAYKEGLPGRGRDHVLLYGQNKKLDCSGTVRAVRERGRLDREKAPVPSIGIHCGVSSIKSFKYTSCKHDRTEVNPSLEEEDGLENLLRSHSHQLSGF